MTGAKVGDALRASAVRLAGAGVETPRLDAEVLLAHVLDRPRLSLIGRDDDAMTPAQAARFAALIARRATREPIAYITGHREFWSLDFEVGPGLLIPRPDSETLVEAALRQIDKKDAGRLGAYRLLDLGVGTGCLLLSLLHELPNARGIGVDISGAALKCAARNAARLGLSERAAFRKGDMWNALAADCAGPFDIVISNPPYIRAGDMAGLMPEVRLHEPKGALLGGEDGLRFYREIAAKAADYLADGGILAVETGHDQAQAVIDLFQPFLNASFHIIKDLSGLERVALAQLGEVGRAAAEVEKPKFGQK